MSYPKDDTPNEKDIASVFHYTYDVQDSFLIERSQIIRFYDQNGKLKKPDTLAEGKRILNVKSAEIYKNNKDEIIRNYKFDNQSRLIEVIDNKGKTMFRLKYLTETKIEMEKYSYWKKEYKKAWTTFNIKSQIIKNYDESNLATHEFQYNKRGEMIEEKSFFKDKAPNYLTFEYLK